MKANINHHLFTQVNLDSGALTVAASVIHNFPVPGTYDGVVGRGDSLESSFHLVVDEKSTTMQLNLDLADLARPERALNECKCKEDPKTSSHFEVNPKGYVLMYVSRGAGGYAVRISGVDKDKPVQFDSRDLKAGDLFVVSLLRPGTFSLTNKTGAKGTVVVAFPPPKRGKELFNRAKPAEIRCLDKEFVPPKIDLEVAQGQIYRIEAKADSRIKIELQKADDGPKVDQPPKVYQWHKPPRARTTRPGTPAVTRADGVTPAPGVIPVPVVSPAPGVTPAPGVSPKPDAGKPR